MALGGTTPFLMSCYADYGALGDCSLPLGTVVCSSTFSRPLRVYLVALWDLSKKGSGAFVHGWELKLIH